MAKISVQDERGYNQVFMPVGSTPVRTARRSDWFASQIAAFGAHRVLEFGCGTGGTAADLASRTTAEIVAVDISPAFIDSARTNHQAPNLRFELFDLLGDAAIPFGRFDLVYGNGILHHLVKQLPQVLRAMRTLVGPGGGMAFIEPNLSNPYCAFIFGTPAGRRWARLEPDEMAFRAGPLKKLLREEGWKDIRVATRDFLVPGLPPFLIAPIQAVEPALEATAVTRWLAQSHFVTASA